MEEIMSDEVDYFLNDIEYFCLNSKSEEIFNSEDKHLFVGISPFNSYFSDTIPTIAKWCKKYSKDFTFFYVDELAKYTLAILKPHYDQKKINEELRHQRRNVKNRVSQSLKNIGYDENQINKIYKEFRDFKDHPVFIENFEKTLKDHNLKTELYNFCNKLVNKIIENNCKNYVYSQKQIEYAHLYFLNEIAFIESLSSIYNGKNIILPYHNKDIIEIADFIKNEAIGVCFLNIKPKKSFINQITDDINIFIIDKKMRYRYISQNMIKTINEINNTSLSKNQILDKTYFEIFGICDKELVEIDKNIINKKVFYKKEEIVEINGKIKYFKVVKKPLYNKKKEIIGLIGSSTDITEIKEAQIKAEKEKYEESLFNEKYTHELNNILHKQRQIKFLLNGSTLREEDGAVLSEILEFENSKFFYITENFTLHNNYLSQGKEILLQRKLTNIVGLIEKEVVYFNFYYKYLNQNRLIIFEKDLDDYKLMIDEVKISQLVHNLIKNADKHSESTIIKIEFKILDDKAVILIKDDGKGIDSHINKEDLFVVDKDKKITKSGSGLGLPICKSIINQHDGDIYFKDVESGTAIEFFLPL